MSEPVSYAIAHHATFVGIDAPSVTFDRAAVIVLPVPFESPGSRVLGTCRAPQQIIEASTYMDWWDEELSVDAHDVGILTAGPMDFAGISTEDAMIAVRRAASGAIDAGKFLVALGGEHAISAPIVAAAAARHPGLSVLHLGARASLRDSFRGSRVNDECSVRRILDHAPCVQVGIRSLSQEEAGDVPRLRTTIVYDHDVREDPRWLDRVLNALSPTIYITIDVGVFDPSVMPAVAVPQPGGFTWRSLTALLRDVFRGRRVVGCDVVNLCTGTVPGIVAPTYLCAKLAYKLVTLQFASR